VGWDTLDSHTLVPSQHPDDHIWNRVLVLDERELGDLKNKDTRLLNSVGSFSHASSHIKDASKTLI